MFASAARLKAYHPPSKPSPESRRRAEHGSRAPIVKLPVLVRVGDQAHVVIPWVVGDLGAGPIGQMERFFESFQLDFCDHEARVVSLEDIDFPQVTGILDFIRVFSISGLRHRKSKMYSASLKGIAYSNSARDTPSVALLMFRAAWSPAMRTRIEPGPFLFK
ncbi:hypothetical protein BH18PSE1_BH18PSE1_11340 [soil metagenome]